MDKAHVRSVYRRLWRAGHIAIHNRSPFKRQIRSILRDAFRNETQLPCAQEIDNTEQFLLTAGRRKGVEARVVRNLCHVHYVRSSARYVFGMNVD